MTARLDPFVDVLLREQADQLYLLPDEPVTIVKDGKPRKVSKQPLTDAHIYALLAEIAPSDSADKIDRQAETEFEYVADRGLVRVRIVPETGRLTAVISPTARPARSTPQPAPLGGVERRRSQGAAAPVGYRGGAVDREPGRATGATTASGAAGGIRRRPVPRRRSAPRRPLEAAGRERVVGLAPARRGAAGVPHPRSDRAATGSSAHERRAGADAAGDHAGAQSRRVEGERRLGFRL